MKKYGLPLLFLCLILWLGAEARPAAASDPTPTLAIETIANLGLPGGNAEMPRYLALDESGQRLFILSEGHPTTDSGNKLSLFDLAQGQITQHLKINQGDDEPLGLQFDPASGQLYALWGQPYGEARPTLSVIDSHSMQVAQEIPNIEAFAVANGMLYMASAEQVSAVNLANNSLEQAQRLNLPPASATGPLAIDPAANRLYLARSLNGVWGIDIYEASSLTLRQSYPIESQVRYLFPTPAGLTVISDRDTTYFVTRLTPTGELAALPAELGQFYGPIGMAMAPDGQTLYYGNGQYLDPVAGTAPALLGLNLDSGQETLSLPLTTNVENLIIDSTGKLAYGLYPYEHHLYQLNLARKTVQLTATMIQLRDVLVDAAHDRLFVSDSGNRIRQLDRQSLAVLADTQLTGNPADFGFRSATWGGELALDPARNRLYVSGKPTVILNADTLAEIDTLTPGGQVAVAPGGQNLYLSNCGVTVLNADGLTGGVVIPGSTARLDGMSPNPCVDYSTLDAANQWLYSIAPNGVPGSNGGSYLYVYDVAAVQPTMIFTDTDISLSRAEPDPAGQRAFVGYRRNSNRRLRGLDMAGGRYTTQLFGVEGDSRYSPASRRLYLVDSALPRLLTLDGATLDVLAELALPDNYYRLVEIDAERERLYLIDGSGNLLIAAPATEVAPPLAAAAEPARPASGPVLSLSTAEATPIFARLEATLDEYASQPRLYRADNPTAPWQDLSLNLPSPPPQTLAVSPNFAGDKTLLAGLLYYGQSGGLYKSTDGGGAWQPAMTGLRDLWVQQLFIAPDFGQTGLIFAHTTYGGLHQSTDGGATWQALDPPDSASAFPLSSNDFAAAVGPQTVLISQAGPTQRGLYLAPRQADGAPGRWQQVFNLPAPVLGLSPDGRVALAFNSSLWRSADGGQSWQIGGSGLTGLENLTPASILFSPNFAQDQTVYLFFKDAVSTSTTGRLFRSTDGGQNWSPWQLPADSPTYTAFTLTPTGDILLGDAAGQLTQLPPTGLTWAASTLPTAKFPVDEVALSRDSQTLFAVAGPVGLFKSTNGGKGWQPTAFPARTFGYTPYRYRLGLSPDFERDQTIFVATGVSLHRSTDGGQSWQSLAPTPKETFLAQRVALSPNYGQDKTLLVGTPAALYRSTDGGTSWAAVLTIEGDPLGPDLLLFAPDGRTAYARFGYGRPLYRSDDGGQSWQPQTANRDEYFSLTAADANAEGLLSGAVEFERSLLQTGPQTPPWGKIDQTLPPELSEIKAVAYYPPNGNLYLSGPGGMFFSPDNSQSWQPFPATGLPGQPEFSLLKLSDTGMVGAMADGSLYRFLDGETAWKDISINK